MSEKDWRIRLDHISDCIRHVEKCTKGLSKEEFDINIDVIRITERNIEIIAEAIKSIPDDIKAAYPDIPWRDIVGTRNIITHLYDGVDEDILWAIVQKGLPALKMTIEEIRQKQGLEQ